MTEALLFKRLKVTDLLKSKQRVLTIESDIQPLVKDLRIHVGEVGLQVMLIDFWNIVEAKAGFLDRTLGQLLRNFLSSRVILVNLREKDLDYIAESPRIGGAIARESKVMPALDRSDRIRWLGCPVSVIEKFLTAIYSHGKTEENVIKAQLNLSKEEFAEATRILNENPQWFERKSAEKKTTLHCSIQPKTLLKQVRSNAQQDLIELFQSLNVKRKGHFVLPSGKHANNYFATSLAVDDSQLIGNLATEIWRRSRNKGMPDVVLVYSILGVYVGDQLVKRYDDSPKLCVAHNYFNPQPQFDSEIKKDQKVLIVTDVVSSGRLITRLRDFLRAHGAIEFGCYAIIDAGDLEMQLGVESIIHWPIDIFDSAADCIYCKNGADFEVVDPFTSVTYRPVDKWGDIGRAIESYRGRRGLLSDSDFWPMADATQAFISGHLTFNGRHYIGYVDTRKILKRRGYRSVLAQRAVDYYLSINRMVSFVVYPAHESAALLAKEIADHFRIAQDVKVSLVPAGKHPEDNTFEILPTTGRQMSGQTVLFVDDGANSANTLMGVDLAIKKFDPSTIEYCIFVDRLRGYSYELAQTITKHKLVSLYSLWLPVFSPKECPICNTSTRLEIKSKTTAISGLREFYRRTIEEKKLRKLDDAVESQ